MVPLPFSSRASQLRRDSLSIRSENTSILTKLAFSVGPTGHFIRKLIQAAQIRYSQLPVDGLLLYKSLLYFRNLIKVSGENWDTYPCLLELEKLYRNNRHHECAALVMAHLEHKFGFSLRDVRPEAIESAHTGSYTWACELYGVGGRLQMTCEEDVSTAEDAGITCVLILHFMFRKRISYSREDRLFREEISEIIKLAQELTTAIGKNIDRALRGQPPVYNRAILNSGCLDPIARGQSSLDANRLFNYCVSIRKEIIGTAEALPKTTKEQSDEEETKNLSRDCELETQEGLSENKEDGTDGTQVIEIR